MSGWSHHTGLAAALASENVDTDQLIPARFMSAPRSEGYGRFLLHDARFDEAGNALDHPLNAAQPTILVTGRNFGSGSSREAAVYALADYGIRAVLAPSFGDIFASNAVNNGLLPGRLDQATHAALMERLGKGPAEIAIDLERLRLACGELDAPFGLDPVWQTKLRNGWDDIDLARQYADEIAAFANARRAAAPWAWPAEEGG